MREKLKEREREKESSMCCEFSWIGSKLAISFRMTPINRENFNRAFCVAIKLIFAWELRNFISWKYQTHKFEYDDIHEAFFVCQKSDKIQNKKRWMTELEIGW